MALCLALNRAHRRHGASPFSSSIRLFFDLVQYIQAMVYLLEPDSKAARAEDGDHGHGHEDPPPLLYHPQRHPRKSEDGAKPVTQHHLDANQQSPGPDAGPRPGKPHSIENKK